MGSTGPLRVAGLRYVKSEDDARLAEELDGSMAVTHFSAYFDESGTKVDTVAVVVAGFIASAEQWIAFERDWKHILSMFGVSSRSISPTALENIPHGKVTRIAARICCPA